MKACTVPFGVKVENECKYKRTYTLYMISDQNFVFDVEANTGEDVVTGVTVGLR